MLLHVGMQRAHCRGQREGQVQSTSLAGKAGSSSGDTWAFNKDVT